MAKRRTAEVSGRPYRVDFRVRSEYGLKIPRSPVRFEQESEGENASKYWLKIPRIAVALDGHEFHERTKYQVAQDTDEG